MQGGAISVHSEVGKGSTFTIAVVLRESFAGNHSHSDSPAVRSTSNPRRGWEESRDHSRPSHHGPETSGADQGQVTVALQVADSALNMPMHGGRPQMLLQGHAGHRLYDSPHVAIDMKPAQPGVHAEMGQGHPSHLLVPSWQQQQRAAALQRQRESDAASAATSAEAVTDAKLDQPHRTGIPGEQKHQSPEQKAQHQQQGVQQLQTAPAQTLSTLR